MEMGKFLAGGTHDAEPLESWGMNKGRISQRMLTGTAFSL